MTLLRSSNKITNKSHQFLKLKIALTRTLFVNPPILATPTETTPKTTNTAISTDATTPKPNSMRRVYDSFKLHPEFWKNQDLPIDDEFKGTLKKLLDNFQAPIRYAFAYGSGVFPQKGYDQKSEKMIDFIFGVRHPQHWHSLNLMQHRDHYSFMGSIGSGAISTLQENFGPGVYFNPYVKVDGMLIKYGVVSIDKLCKDLLDWETLYLAGRMHKPIKILRDDARVRLAQQVNLTSALRTALLLLPKDFTEEQLYLTIASLSYKGDFRRYFGENPNKLKNIVLNQMHNFNLLYSGLINVLPNVEFISDGRLQQDDSPKAKTQLIKKLPRLLSYKMQEEHRMILAKNGQKWPSDTDNIYKSIINSGHYDEYIETSLKEIVFRSAIAQSLKGILTAGFKKSIKYSLSKVGKWIKRS